MPVSLLDLNASTWFLESADGAKAPNSYMDRETTEADPYLDLLDNDPNFRMSSYLRIEKSLNDRGLEREARHIYVAGRYRDVRQKEHIGTATAQHTGSKRPALSMWRTWNPNDGRPISRFGIVWAISRPRKEYCAFLIGLAYILFFFGAFFWLAKSPPILLSMLGFWFTLTALCYVAWRLRDPLYLFVDQVYWWLLEYGKSASSLIIVIATLFFISLAFVSSVRGNFVPKYENTGNTINNEKWGFDDQLWITLQYHIPLVSTGASDNWQPSGKGLKIALVAPNGIEALGPFWPSARDWFALMLWINWLLWPLFLPYLIHRLMRSRGAS